MSPCCGRANNNSKKGAAGYYERYAFLSSAQKEQQIKIAGNSCSICAAITIGDPCSVCGNPKQDKNQKLKEE